MRGNDQDSSMPYCRCRVLYLGSSVPHTSKEGLLGIQEPLRGLYPEQGALGARGVDSWLSVWSNGLLLENVDEHHKKVTRFFTIEALHYCAAVRHVKTGNSDDNTATRFFPLDSPFAHTPSVKHPPLFAAVLRRTTGIKVLECHAFICKRDMAANALVRCCFHAYADSRFAKGLEPNDNGTSTLINSQSCSSLYHTLGGSNTTLVETNENISFPITQLDTGSNDDMISLYSGDENHKVWERGRSEIDPFYQEQGTLRSTKGSRPRQLIAPPSPPPLPPLAQPLITSESEILYSKKKTNKKIKKLKNRSSQDDQIKQHHYTQHQAALFTNGHGHHTLGHPTRQQPSPPSHGYHPLPHASRSITGTLAKPTPIILVPTATLPRKAHQYPPRGIRPLSAPIVPLYAPLPIISPPPPANYPGNYGTTGNSSRRSHHLQDSLDLYTLGVKYRRMAVSQADLSVTPVDGMNFHHSLDIPENDSCFGTGIYRRKGHLNERAFSYSIRAEHRSRSHGSIASLGFTGQQNDAESPALSSKEGKKDRDITQMALGLNLDGYIMHPDNDNGLHYNYQQHFQSVPRPNFINRI